MCLLLTHRSPPVSWERDTVSPEVACLVNETPNEATCILIFAFPLPLPWIRRVTMLHLSLRNQVLSLDHTHSHDFLWNSPFTHQLFIIASPVPFVSLSFVWMFVTRKTRQCSRLRVDGNYNAFLLLKYIATFIDNTKYRWQVTLIINNWWL